MRWQPIPPAPPASLTIIPRSEAFSPLRRQPGGTPIPYQSQAMPLALAIRKRCDNGCRIAIIHRRDITRSIASSTSYALQENQRNRKFNQRKLKLVISSLCGCIHCRGRTSGGGDIVVGVGHCFDDYFDVIGVGST